VNRFLEVDDLTPSEFAAVLDAAACWKREPGEVPQVMAGRGAALLFEKPSARTRSSTEMAVVGLGGHPIYIRPDEVGLGVREPVADVVRARRELVAEEHAHDDPAHGRLDARREVELLTDGEVVDHAVELADDQRAPGLQLAQRERRLDE